MNEEQLKKFVRGHFKEGREGKKQYVLMLFKTEIELGISGTPNRWECINALHFDNGTDALTAYSEIPNPASQLADGYTEEELELEVLKIYHGMKDEKWLERNLYPYL